ncbi:MAG TPA: CehA/McbA family metallohydrolase [Polyangiaceae bacterium]|nr:CehA/McbA family metallohydrolase [Polyangiaceae bacterium]
MSRRVALSLVAFVAVAVAMGGGLWAAKRFRAPVVDELHLPQEGGGVKVAWAQTAPAAGATRDFLVESDLLRLVVSNDGSGIERHQRYGALIDLGTPHDREDELIELESVLYVAGAPVPLRTVGVEVSRAGERPVLAVEEASRDGRFELRTEYRVAPRQSFVELVSTVTNASDKKVNAVELGDHGRWPGTTAFAPRLGYVHLATRADVPWFGRAGKKLSYGFVFPERPAQTAFQFDVVGPAGEVALGASADLGAHASLELRRDAIVVEGGLGKLAEVAWQRLGKPIGYARGVLHPRQTWATVSARHPDGRTVLSVPVAPDGTFELPLPVGEYRFVLQAPGGEDEEIGSVREGAELTLGLVPPRPGMLSYLITDEQQQPLPGRLVVRGVPPTKDPDLVPAALEAGSKNMLYSLTGSGTVELPAGRYDVLATHGPEYTMPRQELEVNADLGATFRGEMKRSVDTSGWLASDFHVHASPSKDSNVPLTERVLTLAAEGIELAVPTDHNHVTDYTDSIHTDKLQGRITSMTGVEITTLSWGHFNAYPYAKSLEVPPTLETSPLEIFAVVRARAPQAVLQVNHPRMPGVGYFNRGELDTKTGVAESPEFSFAFDTLEVSNGFDLEDPRVFERNLREWFELLNVGHRYTAVGNSDSHRVVFQWAGWPRTYVRVPDQDVSRVNPLDVAKALTAGHAVVSCGIFVLPLANGSAGPGDTVLGSRVTLAISLRAPDWVDVSHVEVYANGGKVEERTREAPHESVWNLEVDLDLKSDSWIVVVARGDKFMNDALPGKWIKPFGFSNPIFVDADSDGVFVTPGP